MINQENMLMQNNIYDFTKYMIKNTKSKPVYQHIPKNENWILPKEKNPLFWLFCILKDGESEYLTRNKTNDFTYESNKRIEFAQNSESDISISLLKTHKIKPVHNLIIDFSTKVNLEIFVALCVVFNLSIIYVVKHNQYFEIGYGDETPKIVTEQGIYIGNNLSDEVSKIRTTMYKLESFNAKLKSLASYNKPELVEMAERMKIDTTDLKLKKDFYIHIAEIFNFI